LGFVVCRLEFRVRGLGFRAYSVRIEIQGSKFRVKKV